MNPNMGMIEVLVLLNWLALVVMGVVCSLLHKRMSLLQQQLDALYKLYKCDEERLSLLDERVDSYIAHLTRVHD